MLAVFQPHLLKRAENTEKFERHWLFPKESGERAENPTKNVLFKV